MNKKLQKEFEKISYKLIDVLDKLEELESQLTLDCDKREISVIIGDLFWAVENCTVIGLHQIGQALDDKMGCS